MTVDKEASVIKWRMQTREALREKNPEIGEFEERFEELIVSKLKDVNPEERNEFFGTIPLRQYINNTIWGAEEKEIGRQLANM